MPDATPIVLTLDADADPTATAELAKVFLELGVEATLMLSASTASQSRFDRFNCGPGAPSARATVNAYDGSSISS